MFCELFFEAYVGINSGCPEAPLQTEANPIAGLENLQDEKKTTDTPRVTK